MRHIVNNDTVDVQALLFSGARGIPPLSPPAAPNERDRQGGLAYGDRFPLSFSSLISKAFFSFLRFAGDFFSCRRKMVKCPEYPDYSKFYDYWLKVCDDESGIPAYAYGDIGSGMSYSTAIMHDGSGEE